MDMIAWVALIISLDDYDAVAMVFFTNVGKVMRKRLSHVSKP